MGKYKMTRNILIILVIFWFSYSYLFQCFLSLFFHGNIALKPIGAVSNRDIQITKKGIEEFYGFKVTVLRRSPLPKSAYYKPRNRYDAGKLLEYLDEKVPERYDKIIGVTSADIQTNTNTQRNWGILGLAKVWQKPCVVSTHRLTGRGLIQKYKERLSKVVVHEVGHTLGLSHCTNSTKCVMRAAQGKLTNIDKTKLYLCTRCKSKIKYTQT